jgi:hypothetical protein
MERKIGETFTYGNKTYQVVKVDIGIGCKGCAFETSGCSTYKSFLGHCHYAFRRDNTSVIFKLINNNNNNMEIKNNQLTIEIPEGMEIDTENSSLAEGIVKFKKHDITYNDILQACPTNFGGLRVRIHCMDKILAISQLMNIAKYYNGDWKPNWCNTDEYKYYIIYKSNDNTYVIDYSLNYIRNNIYFRNKKDAIDIINNPNFKTILDAIYKN